MGNRLRHHCHAQTILLQSLSWSCALRSQTCCAHANNSETVVLLMYFTCMCTMYSIHICIHTSCFVLLGKPGILSSIMQRHAEQDDAHALPSAKGPRPTRKELQKFSFGAPRYARPRPFLQESQHSGLRPDRALTLKG